jgi:ribosomal protein L11 methylase PrmA
VRTSYAPEGQEEKQRVVAAYLDRIRPATVWDLGANTGSFSRLAARKSAQVIAFDQDPACIEACYEHAKRSGAAHLLPLVLDLANPSAGLGWAHHERMSLVERGPADAVLALALVHHLAIGNNVPLAGIAAMLSELGEWLVIEFVPKSDPQVREMLAAREDVFPDHTRACFEEAFAGRYAIEAMAPVPRSDRRIYLMRRKG